MYAEREREGARVTAMLVWGDGGGVVGMSVGHEYMGGTCGSGIVSKAANVLGMSVVHRMKYELVECVKYVCVWLQAA